jgi:alpha-L-fucosidase 2
LKNGTLDNLWDTHPPFQIDGNFGGTSGITELLLQSHMGFIHLLPALPDAWEEGSVEGLCARGAFDVNIKWEEGALKEAVIYSKAGQPCVIKYGEQTCSFKTKQGGEYHIFFKNGRLYKQ